MRKLLISAAAFALLAAPALADPPGDRGNRGHGGQEQGGGPPGHGGEHGRGSAPQAAMPAPAAPERGNRGQMAGPPPQMAVQGPREQNRNFDRGNRDQLAAPQAPQYRDFNRGERGPAPQLATQAPQDRGDRNRGDRFDRRGPDNRNAFNDNRAGSGFNRDGRGNFRSPGFGGQRRDFSSFRDFHRDFRAPHRFRVSSYRRPSGWYGHRWSYGEYLPAAFWVRDYWLVDFAYYDLPPPPYGAIWVRVDRDALLIDEDSGEIITVVYDVFY